MSLNKIVEIQENNRQRKMSVYKKVYDLIESKINVYVSKGSQACIYKIPEFIMGYPLINVPETMEYVLYRLNHNGLIAFATDTEHIYISWELSSERRKEIIAEKKKSKILLSNTQETGIEDSLIRYKLNKKY